MKKESPPPSYNKAIIKGIERKTGQPLEKILDEPLDVKRARVEKLKGKSLKIRSEFPWIGRGNVNREFLTDSDTINKEVDKLLKR